MAVTRVGYSTLVPSTSTTTPTVTLPSGIQAGDLILLGFVKNGSATGLTQASGPTFTHLSDGSVSGVIGGMYYRQADGSESSASVGFTTTSAYRTAIFVVVYRGVAAASIIDQAVSQIGNVVSTATAPAATAGATDARVDFIMLENGAAPNPSVSTPAAGMTLVTSITDPNTTGGAYTGGGMYENLTTISSGSVAPANTYALSGNLLSVGFTVLFKALAASSSVKPISVVSAGSWSAVGAANLAAALADALDSTYAQSVASPVSESFEVACDFLVAPDGVTATYKIAIDTGTSMPITAKLKQGSTVISTWTDTATTAPTQVSHTTTTGEFATIAKDGLGNISPNLSVQFTAN